MSDSSSPVSFVPLTDQSSATRAPAEPSVFYSLCGTRARAIRCSGILLLVSGLVAIGLYFNSTMHSDRSDGDDPARTAMCNEWVYQYHIIPDGVANCPLTTSMQLLYNHTVIPYASQVKTGTALTSRPPTVELPSVQVNHSYSFALLDVDFPYADNISLSCRTHYLVVNIPGGISPLPLDRGDTLFNYTAPCPLPRPGWHRYLAVVYDQHAISNITLGTHNITMVPPAMMRIQGFLSALVGFDLGESLLGGTFFYGQFESLTCGLF